jgi:hypothetical protein
VTPSTTGKVAAVKLKAVPINRSGGIAADIVDVDVDIVTESSLHIVMPAEIAFEKDKAVPLAARAQLKPVVLLPLLNT